MRTFEHTLTLKPAKSGDPMPTEWKADASFSAAASSPCACTDAKNIRYRVLFAGILTFIFTVVQPTSSGCLVTAATFVVTFPLP